VEVGTVLSVVFTIARLFGYSSPTRVTYLLALDVWLLLTVLFANFATALAEARGKAQAHALRKTRPQTPASRQLSHGTLEETNSTLLKAGDLVVVAAGQIIPGDGEIIEAWHRSTSQPSRASRPPSFAKPAATTRVSPAELECSPIVLSFALRQALANHFS